MPGIDSNTKLMLHCNGADTSTSFPDDSPSSHVITANGTAQVDTAESKFGGASLFLDGNSDYLSAPDSADWDIGGPTTDDYTIDFWFKFSGTNYNNNSYFMSQFDNGSNHFALRHSPAIGGFQFLIADPAGNMNVTASGSTISDNNWHHVAFIKVGGSPNAEYAIYLDGNQVGYASSDTVNTFSANLHIGTIAVSAFFGGWLDEVRIQKSNFFNASPNVGLTDTITVPTEEYSSFIAPQPPTSLTANAVSSSQIDLSWTAPIDTGSGPITGYKIERESPVGGGFSVLVADTGNTNTTYSDTGLTPGTQYNYRVSAINSGGTGDPSNEANDTTDADISTPPLNLVVEAQDCGELKLFWDQPANDNGSAITGYKIERESPIGGGFSVLVADTGNTNTEYLDQNLGNEIVYNYRVSAINGIGTSSPSNEDDEKTSIPVSDETVLLAHFNGIAGEQTTIDSSSKNQTVTIRSGSQLESEAQFGRTSLRINRGLGGSTTGGAVVTQNGDDFEFISDNTDNRTISFWVKQSTASPAQYLTVYVNGDNTWRLLYDSGLIRFFVRSATVLEIDFSSIGTNVNNDAWHHVALVKIGNNYGIYLDGVQVAYETSNFQATFNSDLLVGFRPTDTNGLNGNIDELLFTKGNFYGASPNVGLSDTITVPDAQYCEAQFPDPPTSLIASPVSSGQIDLTWVAPVITGSSAIVGYKIERESPVGGGFSVLVADTGNTNTTYSDTGLTNDVEYNYRVSAINDSGAGDPSNEASATVTASPEDDEIRFNPFLKRHEHINNLSADLNLDKFSGKHYKNYKKL